MNGRKQNSNVVYDEAGNFVDYTQNATNYTRKKIDAAGREAESVQAYYQGAPQQTSFERKSTLTRLFDGNGQTVKRVELFESQQVWPPNQPLYTNTKSKYFVRSSVLGRVITELDGQGSKVVTYVYTGKTAIAEQRNTIRWKHKDMITGSYSMIDSSGNHAQNFPEPGSLEYGAMGEIVPQNDPDTSSEMGGLTTPVDYRFGADVSRPEFGCQLNSGSIPCDILYLSFRSFHFDRIEARTQGMEGSRSFFEGEANELLRLVGVRIDGKAYALDDKDLSGVIMRERSGLLNIEAIFSEWSLLNGRKWRPVADYQTYFGFTKDERQKIYNVIASVLDNEDCTKAFEDAGVSTLADQILNGNLGFVRYSGYADTASNDSHWAGKKFADGVREAFRAQIGKIGDISFHKQVNGRLWIVLTQAGIVEWDDNFDVTLVHALIHTGGIGSGIIKTPPFISNNGIVHGGSTLVPKHDLEWMGASYDNIIEKCTGGSRRPKSRVNGTTFLGSPDYN